MNFTQDQISELMLDIANSENGTNLLMQMTLNAFMKSERHLHQQSNPLDYANGYRERKADTVLKKCVKLKICNFKLLTINLQTYELYTRSNFGIR